MSDIKLFFSVNRPGLGRVFREDFLLFYHPCLTTLDQEGSSQVTKRPGKHCKERKRRHNNNPSSSGVIVANNVVKKSFHTFWGQPDCFCVFTSEKNRLNYSGGWWRPILNIWPPHNFVCPRHQIKFFVICYFTFYRGQSINQNIDT